MSLKMKLTSTICAFFLILGLVIMGVFASPQASVNLGGTITFHATDVYANVYGSITGAVESETAGGTLSLTTLNFEAGETTDTSSWENVPLTFNDMGEVITISITIENLATDRPLYASVKDNYGAVTNVTKGMKKGEATYTGDCLTIPQISGDDTNKVTINLTMEVKDKNFSLVDGLRYGYLVNLSNEEIDTSIVRTNSESLGTVTENVVDGVLTVEVQPQEGAQFVGFRKTASGSLQASAVSSEQEFLNFNIMQYGAIMFPYLAIQFDFDEAVAMQLISQIAQNTFMDYSIYLENQELVNIAKQLLESMPQEELEMAELGTPGITETLNILVAGDTSYTFEYVEGDKYQAVFSTSETVENENGYNYAKFPDAGFSIIKGFDLPDGQPTDVTLASTLGGFKVLGMATNWAKVLETNAFSPFTDKCTSITFPDSYTIYPDDELCEGLTKLKTVKLGKNMTSIGDQAFDGCSGLTSITIPEGVTSIGFLAFYGCSGLTSITIPSSVTSIGDQAFDGCSGLTSITIPSSVTSIGNSAFHGCSGLTSIKVSEGNTVYTSRDNNGKECNAIISNNELIAGFKNTTIPEGVTSIGSYALWGCSGLTSITIPNSVTSIGDYAFRDCSGLESITIPSSVTSIGSEAFSYCSGLESITIPEGVTSIGDSAFYGCSGLTNVYYTGSAEEWTTLLASIDEGNDRLLNATIHYDHVA